MHHYRSLLSLFSGVLLTAAGTQAFAQESPTYSRDVAPILQQKCQTCHNPEGIGPMPLMNYQQVMPFAALIQATITG